MAESAHGKAKSGALIRRGLLAVLVSVIGLGVAEGVIRVAGLAPRVRPLVMNAADTVYQRSDNPLLAYELKANYRSDDADLVIRYPRTNSHGQRDIERDLTKPPGVRRILLFGDSVVEGEHVREIDDLMNRQLEALLPGSTQVLNFGVAGYCTRAEVELLRTKGLRFDPDQVIFVFVENDFENFNKQLFELEGKSERPAFVDWLFRTSHFFRATCLQLGWFGYDVEADPLQWNSEALGDNNVVAGFRLLRELSEEHGFDTLVAIWPRFVDERIEEVHYLEPGGDLIVERLAWAEGIPTVRLSETFRATQEVQDEGNPRLLFTTRGDKMHPNEAGCRVAAHGLSQALQRLPELQEFAANKRAAATPQDAVAAAEAKGTEQKSHHGVKHNNLALMLMEQGRFEEAREHCEKALEEAPNYPIALNNMGTVLQKTGHLSEAIEYYRRAVENRPDYPMGNSNWGAALLESGQPDAALPILQKAVELLPTLAEARLNLGIAHLRLRNFQEAVNSLGKAVELDPESAPAHGQLVRAWQALGDSSKSIFHAREAARFSPENGRAWLDLGVALLNASRANPGSSQMEEAASSFETAIEKLEDPVSAIRNLGILRMVQRDPARAVARFEDALRRDPTHEPTILGAVQALRAAAQPQAALETLRRGIQAVPDSPTLRGQLARALVAMGMAEEAIPHYEKILELRPEDAEPRDAFAWVLATHPDAKIRDPQRALKIAQEGMALTEAPSASLLDTLAACHASAGDFSSAIDRCSQAIEATVDPSQRKQRQSRLGLYRDSRPYVHGSPE